MAASAGALQGWSKTHGAITSVLALPSLPRYRQYMATLSLRLVDDDTLRWLRSRAAAHGRSVNAELLDLIAVARCDEMATDSPNPFAASHRRARALGVRTASSARRTVRSDRDRDDKLRP